MYGLKANDKGSKTPILDEYNFYFNVVGGIYTCLLDQTYTNQDSASIEATYKILLPSTAYVINFVAQMDDKIVRAVVKEEAQAIQEYEDAIAEGNTAMLAVQEESPLGNMFNMSIGNILPGKTVNIMTTFINLMRKDGERSYIKIDRDIMPSSAVNSSLRIRFNIPGLKNVTSNVGGVFNEEEEVFSYEGKTKQDDMMFYIEEEPSEPTLIVHNNDTDCHIMVNFNPVFDFDQDKAEFKADIVFLVDRSGSMTSRIGVTKHALKLMIPAIPNTSKFNIVSFGTSFSKLFTQSQYLTEETFTQAITHVDDMSANMGGTNIYGPLTSILNEPADIDYPRVLIVMTDGRVSNNVEVIRLVDRFKEDVYVQGIGISRDADESLLRGVAEAGNGHYEMVHDLNDLDMACLRILQHAFIPSFTDIFLELPDNFVQFPKKIAPVRPGSRLFAFAASRKNLGEIKELTINAKDPCGEPISLNISQVREIDSDIIDKYGALQRVRELMLYGKEEEGQYDEIVDLCVDYQVPATGFAAFVAVIENDEEDRVIEESMKAEVVENASGANTTLINSLGEDLCREKPARKKAKKEKVSAARKKSKQGAKKDKRALKAPQKSMAASSKKKKVPQKRKDMKKCISNDIPLKKQTLSSKIIFKQTFDGQWTSSIFSVIPINTAIQSCPDDIDLNVWITALVCEYFTALRLMEKGVWELHVKKARRTISKILGDRFEKVMSSANGIMLMVSSLMGNDISGEIKQIATSSLDRSFSASTTESNS